MDDYQGTTRDDSVNSSSEDGEGATNGIEKNEGNDCAEGIIIAAAKVRGKQSNSCRHFIIGRVFYKAVVGAAVSIHNNYYHTLTKMSLD